MTENLLTEMITYNSPDIKRINHALKVFGFSRTIAIGEKLTPEDQLLLESSAILHDIGIHAAEEKYNSCAGPYQEELGPDIAKPMLRKSGFTRDQISKICFIIAHHHSYDTKGGGLPLQILFEADFLVNFYEDNLPVSAAESARDKFFCTKTGLFLLKQLYIKE